MAKKKEIEEEVEEVDVEWEPYTCNSPSCGHQITSTVCPYCGHEN
jgi:hypothetical protein